MLDPDYLPEWAIATTSGDLVPGAQLPTRDGRRCGNAHIIEVTTSKFVDNEPLYIVMTDAGSIMRLNSVEVAELFYPPKWVSDVDEVKRRFSSPNKEPQ